MALHCDCERDDEANNDDNNDDSDANDDDIDGNGGDNDDVNAWNRLFGAQFHARSFKEAGNIVLGLPLYPQAHPRLSLASLAWAHLSGDLSLGSSKAA